MTLRERGYPTTAETEAPILAATPVLYSIEYAFAKSAHVLFGFSWGAGFGDRRCDARASARGFGGARGRRASSGTFAGWWGSISR